MQLEPRRIAKRRDVCTAFGAVVMVKHGKGDVAHLLRDAEGHDEEKQGTAEKGKREPDRIATHLHCLARGEGEEPAKAEPRRILDRFRPRCHCRGRFGFGRQFGRHVSNEGLFQRNSAAVGHDLGRPV